MFSASLDKHTTSRPLRAAFVPASKPALLLKLVMVFNGSLFVSTSLSPSLSTFPFLLPSSHISSFESFPRLDPPPQSGKKRLPRALKTTQDMMISSDPVVSSPEAADSSTFLSSPDKTPLITKEELKNSEEQQQGEKEEEVSEENVLDQTEEKAAADWKTRGSDSNVEETTEKEEDGVENGSTEGCEEEQQLQLSVPDLINKDHPQLEPRVRPCDVWLKVSDSRLASTPCSGKIPCRISLGEEVLGNSTPCSKGSVVSPEDSEPHPDLLSFE